MKGKLALRIFGLPAIVAISLFFTWMALTNTLIPPNVRSDLSPSLTIIFALHAVFAFVLLVYLALLIILLDHVKRIL